MQSRIAAFNAGSKVFKPVSTLLLTRRQIAAALGLATLDAGSSLFSTARAQEPTWTLPGGHRPDVSGLKERAHVAARSFTSQTIFGVTPRAFTGANRPGQLFGRGPDQTRNHYFFEAIGTVPLNHTKGAIERPSSGFLASQENATQHITIAYEAPFAWAEGFKPDEATFLSRVHAAATAKGTRQANLFFHGGDTPHESALFRAIMLSHDVDEKSLWFLGSWPSGDGMTADLRKYTSGAAEVELSTAPCSTLLKLLLESSSFDVINILGFSLGAELARHCIGSAVRAVGGPNSLLAKKIKKVALVAADIGVEPMK